MVLPSASQSPFFGLPFWSFVSCEFYALSQLCSYLWYRPFVLVLESRVPWLTLVQMGRCILKLVLTLKLLTIHMIYVPGVGLVKVVPNVLGYMCSYCSSWYDIGWDHYDNSLQKAAAKQQRKIEKKKDHHQWILKILWCFFLEDSDTGQNDMNGRHRVKSVDTVPNLVNPKQAIEPPKQSTAPWDKSGTSPACKKYNELFLKKRSEYGDGLSHGNGAMNGNGIARTVAIVQTLIGLSPGRNWWVTFTIQQTLHQMCCSKPVALCHLTLACWSMIIVLLLREHPSLSVAMLIWCWSLWVTLPSLSQIQCCSLTTASGCQIDCCSCGV